MPFSGECYDTASAIDEPFCGSCVPCVYCCAVRR